MSAGTTEEFKAIVIMANRVAREFNDGALDTCVLSSYALSWLLDPTLDQINARTQWADAGIGVEPVATSLAPEFWDLDLSHQQWVRFPAVLTRYLLVPQKGFARAPDARPSHWRPLAKEITEAIRGLEQATIPEAHR